MLLPVLFKKHRAKPSVKGKTHRDRYADTHTQPTQVHSHKTASSQAQIDLHPRGGGQDTGSMKERIQIWACPYLNDSKGKHFSFLNATLMHHW